METFTQVLSMVGTLLLMLLVFVGAYFAARWMGRNYRGRGVSGQAAHMQLLERLPLGKDQSLLVVRVEDRVFLLGATPQHIEKLDELAPDLFAQAVEGEPGGGDFLSVLKQTWDKRKGGAADTPDTEADAQDFGPDGMRQDRKTTAQPHDATQKREEHDDEQANG